MMKRTRILVTYGWCRTAYVVTRSLARSGYEVIVCDKSGLAMTRFSRYCSAFVKVPDPFLEPERYAEAVFDISEKYRVDYIFPAHEDALPLARLARERMLLEAQLLAPDIDILEMVLDKERMKHEAVRAGIRVPFSQGYKTRDELIAVVGKILKMSGSAILKPRSGNSGKGVHIISSADEIDIAISKFEASYGCVVEQKPIVEEFVCGDVFGVCFLAQEGEISLVFSEKYIRSKSGGMGTSVYRAPYPSDVLKEYARKLVDRIGWTGVGQFDFIGDGRDVFWFLEMNPRVWGGINNSVANGFDFPSALVGLRRGGTVKAAPVVVPKRTMWLLGMIISSVGAIKGLKFSEARHIVNEMVKSDVDFDDYHVDDRRVFFAQCLHYFFEFIKSGGSINPARPDMVSKS